MKLFKKHKVGLLTILVVAIGIAIGGVKLASEDPPLKGIENIIWIV